MGARDKVTGTVTTARQRAPWLDHVIRAWGRYQSERGDRLAAYVTYFGFLSFFPLVALAFAVVGFVVDAYPSAQADLTRQINNFLPGLSDKLNVSTIGHAKVAAGTIGLVLLLLAGLAWIDALREAIRTMWHHSIKSGNFITNKLRDIGILAGLGLTMAASVAITAVSTSAMGWFLQAIGLEGSTIANVALRIVGYALALGVDVGLFLFLFIGLPKVALPFRQVLKGAVLGAVGFEVMKALGSLLVKGATHNPVYGAFAVVVGLLIWINYLARFTLFIAAWTVTAPNDSDVRPSGTADPAIAEEAGIPPSEAAPQPVDAVNGRRPEPVSLARPASGDGAPSNHHQPTDTARAAGYFGLGVVAASTVGVALSGAKAVRELVRSR
jgi:membrane protein